MLTKINDEVFVAEGDIVQLDKQAVTLIKEKALHNTRGRARICAHKNAQDALHEMIIAIRSDSYIRPHRHRNKTESFHLLEGQADVIILDDHGAIQEVVRLGKEHCFYYRLNALSYHTLLIHSPILVIHEVTNGPFDSQGSEYASFAPLEEDIQGIHTYMTDLKQRLASHAAVL